MEKRVSFRLGAIDEILKGKGRFLEGDERNIKLKMSGEKDGSKGLKTKSSKMDLTYKRCDLIT